MKNLWELFWHLFFPELSYTSGSQDFFVFFLNVIFICFCHRFRPQHPMPPQQRPMSDNEDAPKRAAIISEKDLKELEKLRIDNDDGWAGAHEEIDYS
jgi:hypothetical protein